MKCIVCDKEMTEERKDGVPDAKLCIDCWMDWRYGIIPDDHPKAKQIDDEYNYVGMYPHYRREY